MKIDMLDLSKGQDQETMKRNRDLVKELTPVVRIQHLKIEKRGLRNTLSPLRLTLKEDSKRNISRRKQKEKTERKTCNMKGDTKS